jgi:hypothetical protein
MIALSADPKVKTMEEERVHKGKGENSKIGCINDYHLTHVKKERVS